ncbi:LacI family DNA-binding transcriptional regulator [Novosphingopyxis sp.]|uniref:LacI family DNA-binding transcriptional regulator n=1 Tax=Novosphingopyxis sp. TaxID=2709690 RepID=UPI003B5B2BAE
MAKSKPTIDDVAALSGVGRATVSRVINNGPHVRPEMRRRVMEAISKLGYTVNVQARNLATGHSRQVLLIHESNHETEPNSYYFSGLELGALQSCAERGYRLVAQAIDRDARTWKSAIVELVENGRYDGLILPPPFSDDADLIRAIKNVPCALICISAGKGVRDLVPSIGIDDERAGYDIARHLLDLGHRRIAYIKGIKGHASAEMRFAGLGRALAERGIEPASVVAERGNFTFRSGIECGERILEREPDVTAIICANDDMAAGVLLVCHKAGLAVPSQISVAGFDDTPMSSIVWPPLTTVHQPIKDLARRAAAMLLKLVEDGGADEDGYLTCIDHGIVIRQSTAPPPR